MEIWIRPLIETDRPALRRLYQRVRDVTFHWQPASSHRLSDFDTAHRGETVLVAVADDQPIGFAAVWPEESFIHSLFVWPEWQGRGLGRDLLRAALRLCDPARRPTLKCLVRNARARAFYEAQGWAVLVETHDPDGDYWLMAAPASPAPMT